LIPDNGICVRNVFVFRFPLPKEILFWNIQGLIKKEGRGGNTELKDEDWRGEDKKDIEVPEENCLEQGSLEGYGCRRIQNLD
jgi:hypothetical protein